MHDRIFHCAREKEGEKKFFPSCMHMHAHACTHKKMKKRSMREKEIWKDGKREREKREGRGGEGKKNFSPSCMHASARRWEREFIEREERTKSPHPPNAHSHACEIKSGREKSGERRGRQKEGRRGKRGQKEDDESDFPSKCTIGPRGTVVARKGGHPACTYGALSWGTIALAEM